VSPRSEWIEIEIAAGRAIRCPRCGRVSFHPKDIDQRYCGWCHEWHDAMDAASQDPGAA
jgi:ribosomal protein S27AE